MSLRKQYTRNNSLIQDGAWLTVGTRSQDNTPMRICIARAHESNKQFQRALERANRALGEKPSSEAVEATYLDVFARVCITGFDNVYLDDADKEPLAFSEANAVMLVKDFPELVEVMFKFATNSANYVGIDLVDTAQK